ncbi:MAG TPA: hypothetical protein VNS58_00645 [Puia sp.]|nr:hypothetical protein [Puia sp.]
MLYNPFPLLSETLLKDQVAKGKRFFVRQAFARGMDARLKAAFLFRAYSADEREQAERHVTAIPQDPHVFLYDADIPEQLEKLYIAARQPFGYKIFYAAKKGVDWKPPPVYREKIRHYINRHHAGWRGSREGEKIQVGLYEEFGELLLKFSYDGEEDTIPFGDIEKY